MQVQFQLVMSILVSGHLLLALSSHPSSLVSLGVADGKEYFAEVDQPMNRTQAADYCQSNRLNLASIESEAQADLLNETLREHNVPPGYKRYWTAGVESTISLSWDETNAPVNRSLATDWVFRSDRYYCLQFLPLAGGITEFYTTTCADGGYPLCQGNATTH